MDWAIHLANVLILCSFLVSNVSSLRILSITAGVFFGLYFLTRSPPAYGPVCWNVLFGLVNTIKLIRIWRQRRKIPLSQNERFLHEQIFPKLFPVDVRNLTSKAELANLSETAQSIDHDRLYFVLKGSVNLPDQDLKKGSFLGISGYLQPNQTAQTKAASGDALCFSWTHQDLQGWTEQDRLRKNQLMFAFSRDLLSRKT